MSLPRVAVGIAAAILVTGSALPVAQSRSAWRPLGRMTCADFLLVDDAAKPEIVYWAATHDRRGRPESDDVDVDGTDRIVPVLVEQCQAAPGELLWAKVRTDTGRTPTSRKGPRR